RVLALVEGGDGVDVQIHAQSVAELIGDQLRIDTGLTRQTGMRASHDLKGRPFQLDGFQPRRQEPPPGIVAPKWCGELCRGEHPCVEIFCCRHWVMRFCVVEDKATVRFERSLLGRSSLPR